MFTCGPAFFAGAVGGGGYTSYYVDVTVPAASVSANLTDFPVMLRLSGLPAGFWTHVKTDGGDVRATTTGGTTIPHDLSRFDYTAQDGVLWVKTALSSSVDTVIRITYGNSSLSKLAVGDANGRNAVWADYESVFLLGESAGDDRTGKAQALIEGDPITFAIDSTSPDLGTKQGVCWDGTYFYTTDTNVLKKWDASWAAVATNSDPVGDAAIGGSPTVNHCGDPDVHGGLIYVPMECYPASGGLYNAHIGVFNASDLSFVQSFDISAQAHEASSIAYCDFDDLLYIVDFDGNNSTIYKYDPADGSYEGTLSTTQSIAQRQGITWWHDHFWVVSDSLDEVVRVTYAGATTLSSAGVAGGPFGIASAGNFEGIGHTHDELLLLVDHGAVEEVQHWKPYDLGLSGGGGALENAVTPIIASGRSSYQTYTLAVTAAITTKGFNRVPVSYWNLAAGPTNTRQVIAYRTATTTLAIWDVNNSWLDCSPIVNPTVAQPYRIHAVYQSTTSRRIYVDGTQRNSQAPITAVPSNLDTIRIFSEDTSNSEIWDGEVGFVYLRPSVLSADWIAAEYSNLNAPGSFYSVGSETGVP